MDVQAEPGDATWIGVREDGYGYQAGSGVRRAENLGLFFSFRCVMSGLASHQRYSSPSPPRLQRWWMRRGSLVRVPGVCEGRSKCDDARLKPCAVGRNERWALPRPVPLFVRVLGSGIWTWSCSLGGLEAFVKDMDGDKLLLFS